MLTRHLTNKIIDIRLEEEKYYFPGETIQGVVIVHPKNAIKVNHIQLRFTGQVYIYLKEKEINTLFQETTILSVCPDSASPKQTTLDPSEHTFPFTFVVPKSLNLPSTTTEYSKNVKIQYTINALLDRPMLLESLCPKVEYSVPVLEFIDIDKAQFKVPQEKMQDIMLPTAKYNQKCMVKASMPRLGFTRGDIVPLKVTVDHFTSFSRKDGVTIDLVRTVEIRTTKHTVFKEAVLRSTPFLLDIKEPDLSQTVSCQMFIPTSTAPSIRYKDKVLRFHYKIRVSVYFTADVTSTLDLPIVVGTWPRASVPIEDDDEDTHDIEESVLTYEEDDLDIESLKACSIDDQQSINSRRTSSNILPSWQSNSSNSNLTTAQRNSMISTNGSHVGRSDSITSNRSHNSTSSWKSTRSWEQQQQQHFINYGNLSRNTSQSTTLSTPDRLPSYGNYNTNNNNTPTHNRSSSIYSNDSIYPNTTHNMNRNSSGSTNSFSFQQQQQQYLQQQQQQAYYNAQMQQQQQAFLNAQQQQFVNSRLPPNAFVQNGNNRLSRYSRGEEDASIHLEQDVPTHILEPMSNTTTSFVPLTSPIAEQQESEYGILTQSPPMSPNQSSSELSSSSSEEDSDENDLLAIIERKKRKERRALKKKKRDGTTTA